MKVFKLSCLVALCVSALSSVAYAESAFIKFTSEDSLSEYLLTNTDATRLHKSLLWAEIEEKKLNDSEKIGIVNIELPKRYVIFNNSTSEDITDVNSKLWAFKKVNVKSAWQKGYTGKSITVAIVDTGVNYKHEALTRNIWVNDKEKNGQKGIDDDGNGFVDDVYGWDFYGKDSNPMDDQSHGTHVAGTVGGFHSSNDFYGVAPDVKLMSIKSHSSSGNGTEESVVKSILYAVDNGADVINCSWGGAPEAAEYSEVLKDAIKYAMDNGVILVAAAGNESQNIDTRPSYPASYDLENIVTVASTTKSDRLSYFSNVGEQTVDVAAPGSNIYSAKLRGGYTHNSGTSMAAPFVSGALALYLERDGTDKDVGKGANRDTVADKKNLIINIINTFKDDAEHIKATNGKTESGFVNLEKL